MPPRFFVPDLVADRATVRLPADEARHLSRVLRLGVGETVAVFDGKGNEFSACVETIAGGEVTARLLGRAEPAPEPLVKITLAQAVLKGDKLDDIVRDVTMLGVAAVQPIFTSRVDVPRAAAREGRIDRLRRVAISSAKQCRRAVVPEIKPAIEFERFVSQDTAELRVILVEPSSRLSKKDALTRIRKLRRPETATVVVGPEGGWTDEEAEQATAAGFLPLMLGRRTLRADAVPVIAVAVLQAMWEDL